MSFSLRFLIFLFCPIVALAQAEPNLYGKLQFGPNAVGFKQLLLNDVVESDQRSLNVALWYPAVHSGKQQMKFREYLNYKDEFGDEELHGSLSQMIGGKEGLFSADTLNTLLNANMRAVKNANEKDEKFPLLVWSSRYGTVEYQSVLSEYLASHGYIVAYPEDVPNSPFPWQLQSVEEKKGVLDAHLTDIEHTIRSFKDHYNVDGSKIGMLSWSYAGESAILTQMNNADVDCVVGLSAIGFSYGVYLGQGLSQTIDLKKMKAPYLILSEKNAPNGNSRRVPNEFAQMHENSRHVFFNQLAHGNFNVIEGMLPGVLNSEKVQTWSKGGRLAQMGFESICEMTLSYLEAVLKNSAIEEFDARSRNDQGQYPNGFITVTYPGGWEKQH